MNHLIRISLLLLLPLLASSCLTLEETYSFKANGSGTMTYTMDMSGMANLLGEAGRESGEDPTAGLGFDDVGPRLKNIGGISGVKVTSDNKQYIYTIAFKFANIAALNSALNQLHRADDEGIVAEPMHTYFEMKNGVVTRTHTPSSEEVVDALIGEDEDAESTRMILESMKYRINMSFKQPIKTVYSAGKVEQSGKKQEKVLIEVNFAELAADTDVLNTTVVLKN
ncbi:MAG: hypothetical protein SF053_22130 [Bacteroidia bacterium]|nr:hypothetical protein [Bacteroidia bacterium]